MEKRTFKTKIYNELASVAKAIASPIRMEVIDLLAQGPFSVEKIAEQTGLSVANASQHLQLLKKARLVDIERRGNFIFYKLASDKVFDAWRALRELGIAQNAEVTRLLKDFRQKKGVLEPLSIEELSQKLESMEVILLDVRPEEEYNRGHIHRALSIPIDQLSGRLKELSKKVEIVAYCRGPFCVYADEAVELLRNEGFKAARLAEGFPDWSAKGLPVD